MKEKCLKSAIFLWVLKVEREEESTIQKIWFGEGDFAKKFCWRGGLVSRGAVNTSEKGGLDKKGVKKK